MRNTGIGRHYNQAIALGLLLLLASSAAPVAAKGPVRSLIEMREEHVVKQEWDLSCGAAALTTLLRYQHGLDVTEKDVAKGMISRDAYLAAPDLLRIRQGFSLFDLQRYAESRGFRGRGFGQLSLADVTKRAPILVPIHTHGYDHFVVFRGRLGNRVLLADPAWGNRTMTIEQFERVWRPFPAIGRVGFVVESSDAAPAMNALDVRPELFPTFN